MKQNNDILNRTRRACLVSMGGAFLPSLSTAKIKQFNAPPIASTQDEKETLLDAGGAIAQSPFTEQEEITWLSPEFWSQNRSLWLYRNSTKENINATYFANNDVYMPGYHRICTILRDVSANKAVSIDLTLLNILRGIQGYYDLKGYERPIVVQSGYRSPRTNANTEGAAKNSMHLYGRAVDIFMPGVPLKHLLWFGQFFKKGGVGFYPSNGFIHLDTGNLRYWQGTIPRKKIK